MSKNPDIDAVYEPLHVKLTKMYYHNKEVEGTLFEKAHAVIWLLHEQELISKGIMEDFEVEVNGKVKLRSTQIAEMLANLKTPIVDKLIDELKKM